MKPSITQCSSSCIALGVRHLGHALRDLVGTLQQSVNTVVTGVIDCFVRMRTGVPETSTGLIVTPALHQGGARYKVTTAAPPWSGRPVGTAVPPPSQWPAQTVRQECPWRTLLSGR
jgi:hypothetical protein